MFNLRLRLTLSWLSIVISLTCLTFTIFFNGWSMRFSSWVCLWFIHGVISAFSFSGFPLRFHSMMIFALTSFFTCLYFVSQVFPQHFFYQNFIFTLLPMSWVYLHACTSVIGLPSWFYLCIILSRDWLHDVYRDLFCTGSVFLIDQPLLGLGLRCD